MVRVRLPSTLSKAARIKNKIELFYRKAFLFFGPQKWWPAESPFEVMVGAILTQNTNWLNVEKAIRNLKAQRLLRAESIFRLNKKKLAKLIKPAGYYNIKTVRLKNFLGFFIRKYNGSIKKINRKRADLLRRELLKINGVGPETADSILLYALNKPVFVVDAYTKRILLRHKLIQENAGYDEVQSLFRQRLKRDAALFNEYHALLVRLGKDFCLSSNPRCSQCPLRDDLEL